MHCDVPERTRRLGSSTGPIRPGWKSGLVEGIGRERSPRRRVMQWAARQLRTRRGRSLRLCASACDDCLRERACRVLVAPPPSSAL